MNHNILGVGSRVKHPAFGDGVIIAIDVAAYTCVFITYGKKLVPKDYSEWDIIEQIPAENNISFTEAEKSLVRILSTCLLYTSPSPRDQRGSRMPSSA